MGSNGRASAGVNGWSKSAVLIGLGVVGLLLSWAVNRGGAALTQMVQTKTDPGAASTGNGKENLTAYGGADDRTTKDLRRIAVLSPAGLEIVFALGAGDWVVGGTRFAIYPEAARDLPDLGGAFDVNYERMTGLRPDLVITQNADEMLARFCRERNIQLMNLTIETISDLLATCRQIGQRLHLVEQGEALALRIQADLAAVRARNAGRPRINCFVSVDRATGVMSGLLTAGADNFLTELVTLAGGNNVFADIRQRYPTISKEALVSRAPRVILELKPSQGIRSGALEALRRDWRDLPNLPAVKEHQIHFITGDAVLLPGPRVAEVADQIARVLHPQIKQNNE